MEIYGKILIIVTPIFLALVMLETAYGWFVKKKAFRNMDAISSMSSGYTNSVKDILGLSITLLTYKWMVDHWTIYRVESSIWLYVIAFVSLDLTGYLVHRMSHEINFFWNKHAIHHSSEEFNLACALRQSISSFVSLFTIFLLPAALLGVPAQVIAVVAPLHLFAQFWYHTTYIGKLGFLEKIIVTPSHHRVHHALNPEYMDKNHGQIFIIWDKLFGSFQEELPHVPPVFGISRPVRTWNPIKINFQHLWLMLKDAWYAQNWPDKLRIWFMPTGWRPADVAERFPVYKIEDPYQYERYAPKNSPWLIGWSWVQFFFTFFLVLYFYGHIAKLGTPNMFVCGAFIYLCVFSYTELMDRNPHAFWFEALKNLVGLGLIYQMGGWFTINDSLPWATTFIAVYFVLSTLVTAWFVWFEIRQAKPHPESTASATPILASQSLTE
ncbi:MAG: fatty acid hydroxylase family protein [Cytophagales bacterium]|nr:MAG: fatty acid hydroxylase family protein [Cytophagales bacterium]